MKYEIAICKKCGLKKPIINRRHFLCPECNQIRLHGTKKKYQPSIKNKRYNEKFDYDIRWGFTNEIEMFHYIWDSRPHISEISGKPVLFSPICFLHLLAKGINQYPHFKLNPENVILGTEYEHYLLDNGTQDQRDKYQEENPSVDWDWVYEKIDNGKQEYKKMYG